MWECVCMRVCGCEKRNAGPVLVCVCMSSSRGCVFVYVCMCVCMCVCVCERSVSGGCEQVLGARVCACACECMGMCVCVCVCVCGRERERERGSSSYTHCTKMTKQHKHTVKHTLSRITEHLT